MARSSSGAWTPPRTWFCGGRAAPSGKQEPRRPAAPRLRAAASEYYPIGKGLLRGDAGISLRTNRPVWPTLTRRIGNSLVLALLAFAFIMPIALFLGIWPA